MNKDVGAVDALSSALGDKTGVLATPEPSDIAALSITDAFDGDELGDMAGWLARSRLRASRAAGDASISLSTTRAIRIAGILVAVRDVPDASEV